MKAVVVTRTGGPEVLEFVDVPTPTPGRGQVLIRHEAIGLNFIDVYHRTGLYPMSLPFTPGGEAAGVVAAVGDGVADLSVGDRVAYVGGQGAYAELNLVAAERLIRLPDDIDFATAAAAMLKGMTAEFLADRLWPSLNPGDPVLVHAAAGGVGGILVQWLKHRGQRVIAVAGGQTKMAIARQHGADDVLDYGQDDLAAQVRGLTDGVGVRIVYDSVGKSSFDASLACLAKRGLMVCYGNASGAPPAIEPARLARLGSLFLTRPTLFDYIATPADLAASSASVFDMIRRKAVKIDIGQTRPLSEVKDAHIALEGRATTGATVLIP